MPVRICRFSHSLALSLKRGGVRLQRVGVIVGGAVRSTKPRRKKRGRGDQSPGWPDDAENIPGVVQDVGGGFEMPPSRDRGPLVTYSYYLYFIVILHKQGRGLDYTSDKPIQKNLRHSKSVCIRI